MGLSRRALLIRVALFLGALWLLLALLGGAQLVIPGVPAGVTLPQLAPGLAALIMLAVFHRDAVRLSFSVGSRPVARVGLALAVPLTVAALAAVAAGIAPELTAPALAIAWIPIGALAEELGWRGYLNQLLVSRLRGLNSAIIVGLLWVPFHVGLWGLGALRFGLFAVTLVAASIVIFALVRDAAFSVTIATLFHVAINVGSVMLGEAAVRLPVLAVSAAAWVVAAAGAVLLRPRLFLDPLPVSDAER